MYIPGTYHTIHRECFIVLILGPPRDKPNYLFAWSYLYYYGIMVLSLFKTCDGL